MIVYLPSQDIVEHVLRLFEILARTNKQRQRKEGGGNGIDSAQWTILDEEIDGQSRTYNTTQ